MTLGGAPDRPTGGPAYAERSGRLLAATPLVAGLPLLLVLGVWIPGGLDHADHALDPRDLMTERGRPTTLNRRRVALLPGTDRVQIEHVETRSSASLSHELADRARRPARRPVRRRGGADGSDRAASVYALDRERRYVVLECRVEGDRFPPLSDLDPAAFVEECEIYEQYGIRPDNDKRAQPRADAATPCRPLPPARAARAAGVSRATTSRMWSAARRSSFRSARFASPAWESLYMGLVTTGEEVLDLYLFHWHKHRGIERRLTGLDPDARHVLRRARRRPVVGRRHDRVLPGGRGGHGNRGAAGRRAFARGRARARADLQPRRRDRRAVPDARGCRSVRRAARSCSSSCCA